MLFDSVVFLFSFLPVVLILYYLVPGRLKEAVLLLASLVFYAWGEPVGVLVLICSVIFNYICGLDIAGKTKNRRRARLSLIINLAVNLGVLGFFKYGRAVLTGLGAVLPVDIPYQGERLPIGMTFYTFQILSYIIEVYRGNVKAQKNIMDFALYVTMFPKLLIGPVVRYPDIEKQLHTRQLSVGKLGEGMMYLVLGLMKKTVLADTIGVVYAKVISLETGQMSVLSAWLGCAAFALQIYYDFSGYSDMAVGLGKMLGFDLPKNFDHPYIAGSTTEFWYRWHTSLRGWFREYVYYPLGGGETDEGRQVRNILAVWLLVGLYHGLSWNYIVWGLYCGILMAAEKLFLWRMLDGLPGFLGHIYSIVLVLIGWGFFFSPGIGEALSYLGVMFGAGASGLVDDQGMYLLVTNLSWFIIMVMGLMPFIHKGFDSIADQGDKGWAVVNAAVYALLFAVCFVYLTTGPHGPFLYLAF